MSMENLEEALLGALNNNTFADGPLIRHPDNISESPAKPHNANRTRDKRDYNATKDKNHEVSCLLKGQPENIFRIPDATFGLATFKPQDYQNALASYELDSDRLEALLLNPHCGLISDPKFGHTDLAFPFAVYEAKGWGGDAREARHQACSAAATYLDMLDTLSQIPEPYTRLPELANVPAFAERPPLYQELSQKGGQVFAITSFGSYWHILVGYKRHRSEKEHAGTPGVSEKVYVRPNYNLISDFYLGSN